MQEKVYFDNAATTPLCDSFLENIQELAQKYYNPSASNENALELMQEIEECREKIAKLINCDPEEVYFTSGASESNSWAIDGFVKAHTRDYYRVIATNIEHASILNNPRINGFIECDEYGLVHPEQFEGYRNCLFCVGYGNNEIGTLCPIQRISDVIHKQGNYLFVDATQSLGKVGIDVKKMSIDMLSASGHKLGALKGVGILYVNRNINVKPIIYGSQQNNLRGSTYNYLGIKSLSMAIDVIDKAKLITTLNLRNYLYNQLMKIGEIAVNGHLIMRLPSNLNICIHNIAIDAQQIVALLDMNGFVVSAGSACHAGDAKPSHILKAIGLSDDDVKHSIRITLGEQNTKDEIDAFVACLKNIIEMNKM